MRFLVMARRAESLQVLERVFTVCVQWYNVVDFEPRWELLVTNRTTPSLVGCNR